MIAGLSSACVGVCPGSPVGLIFTVAEAILPDSIAFVCHLLICQLLVRHAVTSLTLPDRICFLLCSVSKSLLAKLKHQLGWLLALPTSRDFWCFVRLVFTLPSLVTVTMLSLQFGQS